MKKKLIIVLMVISGCGIIGRSTRNTSKENSKYAEKLDASYTAELFEKRNSKVFQLNKNSTRSRYQLKIYPKGVLNFSADGTFSGSIDSMMMLGESSKIQNSNTTSSSKELKGGQLKKQIAYQTESNNSAKKTESSSKSGGIWMLVLVMAGLFLFFCFRKWNR